MSWIRRSYWVVICGLVAGPCATGCDTDPLPPSPPPPVFSLEELESGEMVEVMACKNSHEHDLRYVRSVADAASAELYRRCVPPSSACTEARFPPGSLFIKLEYESLTGCDDPAELVSYTASRKLDPDSFEAGQDWHWQRLSPVREAASDDPTVIDLKVEAFGAPKDCLHCHIDHCSAPLGFDLRCVPD